MFLNSKYFLVVIEFLPIDLTSLRDGIKWKNLVPIIEQQSTNINCKT